MTTGRLLRGLPCSWNGCALNFSFPILKSRKDAFVKNRGWRSSVPIPASYKGTIYAFHIATASIDIPRNASQYSSYGTMQRCVYPFVVGGNERDIADRSVMQDAVLRELYVIKKGKMLSKEAEGRSMCHCIREALPWQVYW